MKKLLVVLSLFATTLAVAQAPQFLNYQGIARDASGNVINVGSVGLKFEIIQGSTIGTVVYKEENSSSPSAAGIFTTAIGSGSANIGSFSTINWAGGPYFIRVGLDPAGGTSFTTIGTSQLLSVPYALFAEKAGNAVSYTAGNAISVSSGSIINTAPDQTITIGNGTNVSVTGTYPNFTVSSTPTLAINGSSLSISGGNTVLIPTTGTAAATPNTSITATGNASITSSGTNTFNISVPAQTLSLSGSSLSISGGNTVTLPAPSITLTGTGIAAVSPSVSTIFNINVPPPSFTSIGSTTVSGSYPNYTVTSPAVSTTSITSGSANVIVNGSAPSYTISANIPTLSLTGSTLSSGPATNSVNLSSLSVWSNSVGVLYPTTLSNSVSIGTTTNSSALDVVGNSTLTVGKFTNSTNTGGAVITADFAGGSSAATYYGVKASASAIGGTTYGVYGSAGGGGTAYGLYGSMNGAGGYGVYGIAPAGGNGVGVAGISNAGSTTSAFGVFGSSLNSYGGVFQNSGATITASLGGQTFPALFSGGNVGINITTPTNRLHVIESSNSNAAIFGSQSSAAGSSNAHGIFGLTSNTNTFAAGVHGESTGSGPAVSGNKLSGSGPAGRFEINSTTNTADGLFAITSGAGAAIHAVNGPTVAGSSNNALAVEEGHLFSIQAVKPGIANGTALPAGTPSINGPGTDVAGEILFNTQSPISGTSPFELVRVTFNKTYNSTPVVIITARNSTAGNLNVWVAPTPTGFSIYSNATPPTFSNHQYYYFVIGR